MAFSLANPERLFDRTWRPRHPLRPKLSAARRWGMRALLITLCAVIFGYSWLTDTHRVRLMASSYLSDLLGGDVHIGRASLSIFEGLRLDDVTLSTGDSSQPDSTIFHAQSFLIRYNPAELLAGRLAATQIIAVEPMVTLIEDPKTHTWNYQRILGNKGPTRRHTTKEGNFPVPQIILRDAQVSYMEMRDGKITPVGWYSLEGQLNPSDEPDRYDFQLQSRGRLAMGPSAEGSIRMGVGTSFARLKNFTFGPDIKAMLMEAPRKWCDDHEIQGSIDVPEMTYTPSAVPGGTPAFKMEISLSGVELAVHPREWMSREQNENIQWFHDVLDSVENRGWISPLIGDTLRRLSTPVPIHLRQVSGILVFDEKGITLKGITGKLENNWFNLDGSIDGYSPDAAASLTLSSIPGHDLELPPFSPNYAGSLPPQVQETYERLHPQGECSAVINLVRKENGGTPQVSGQVQIVDGQFDFADFPFPITHAAGTILIGFDPLTKMDGIRIINVQGHGPPGGENANAIITLDGFVGPLNTVAGVWIDVRGTGLHSDPVLRAALPPEANQALRIFDPAGRGDLPRFSGSFICRIFRPVGPHQKWSQQVDISMDDAQGTLTVFPYPVNHITGRLEVRDGVVNIIGVRMSKGDGTLAIDGKVTWKLDNAPPSTQPYGPDLRLVARNMPIDDDLKNALPDQQRQWLTQVGAGGKLDVDGHVFPSQTPGSDVDYVMDLKLHDGTLSPTSGPPAISDLTGDMHVVPDQVSFDNLVGHHGDGTIHARGNVDWSDPAQPKVSVSGDATDLPLDDSLYALLPSAAKDGWDTIKPQGTVDAAFNYDWKNGVALKLSPKKLSVTPALFPYRLDDLQGSATLGANKVTLENFTARHGDATVAFSGEGDLGKQPAWDLKVLANGVNVNDELLRALPDPVADLVRALKVQGKIGMEFSKLAYRPAVQTDATTHRAAGADLDFAAKVTFAGDSLEIGFPATDVIGTLDIAGLVRDGNLSRLAGQISADSLNLAGRPATNLKAAFAKSSDDPVLQVSRIEGTLADGELGGEGQITDPASGSSKYDLSLVLRDADLRTLTAPTDKNIKGRLTASLQLSGAWDDPSSRRGHGDVRVYGEDLYKLPIMAGLLQITNLALPLTSPFSEATTGYSVDGQRVNFDRIDLKSSEMTMSGSGELDFDKRTVNLWLVTDNATLVALPVVGPLLHSAKEELLKIHVKGTIEEPKVSASSFDTITTTVDQVFKGDEQK